MTKKPLLSVRFDGAELKRQIISKGEGVAKELQKKAREIVGSDEDDARDAARYRRLRILGAAPYGKREIMRFELLDVFLDLDLQTTPDHGDPR